MIVFSPKSSLAKYVFNMSQFKLFKFCSTSKDLVLASKYSFSYVSSFDQQVFIEAPLSKWQAPRVAFPLSLEFQMLGNLEIYESELKQT